MRHAKMDEGAAASARSRRCLLLDRKRMASVIMVSAVATGAFAELLPVEDAAKILAEKVRAELEKYNI